MKLRRTLFYECERKLDSSESQIRQKKAEVDSGALSVVASFAFSLELACWSKST